MNLIHGKWLILFLFSGMLYGSPYNAPPGKKYSSPGSARGSANESSVSASQEEMNPSTDSVSCQKRKGNDWLPVFSDNPMILLQAKTTGVNVLLQSAAPGENPYVSIRGTGSLFFNQQPLILLDGIPMQSVQDLYSFDMESIEVVKDPFSLAKYGMQGSNGVILLTSRKGELGANHIQFRTSFGVASLPQQMKLLSGTEAFQLMQELNGPLAGGPNDKSIYFGNSFISDSIINTSDLQNINWQDKLFRIGLQKDYSMGFTGGTDKTKYRVSGSYMDHEGIVKPSDYSKMGLSFQIERQATKRLNIASGVFFSNSERTLVNTNSSAEEGGVILSALATPPFLPSSDNFGDFFVNPLKPEVNNVDANIRGVEDHQYRTALFGNIALNYRIMENLSLCLKGSSNMSLEREKQFMSTKDVYLGRLVKGRGIIMGAENNLWNTKASLRFNKDIKDQVVKLEAGAGLSGSKYSWNRGMQVGYANDIVKVVSVGSQAWSNLHLHRMKTFFAMAEYSFREKYFLSVNVAADASSRFLDGLTIKSDSIKPEVWELQKDEKWGVFEGVSARWKISEESFLKNISQVSNLVLKLSYGTSGNDGGYYTGRVYPYYWNASAYSLNADEDYTRSLFSGIGHPVANLHNNTWEKSAELNLGLEGSLFKDRLWFELNYFSRTSSDLVIPSSDSTYFNSGEIINKGTEISLGGNVISSNFSWNTTLNLTLLSNEVNKTDAAGSVFEIGYNGISNVIAPGNPVFSFWGLQSDGLFQNAGDVAGYAVQPGAGPGDVRYVDQNLDNVIDENDRVIIGNPNPDMILGFNNTFTYNNFELSVFVMGVFGQDVLNLTKRQTEGLSDWINQSAEVANRWTSEGSSNTIPRANIGTNNIMLSDRFIEDGSFIRLKNLTLSYRFPDKAFGMEGLNQLRLWITAQNLLTFTQYSGFDPEVSTAGPLNIDLGGYPNARYIGGGIAFGL